MICNVPMIHESTTIIHLKQPMKQLTLVENYNYTIQATFFYEMQFFSVFKKMHFSNRYFIITHFNAIVFIHDNYIPLHILEIESNLNLKGRKVAK